ncbi:MAG: hypothetical protein AAGA56_02275 [Myxococcota bacterium]
MLSILELDLATLYADIGLADRAATQLALARTTAAQHRLDHLEGQTLSIEAEIALLRGDEDAA